MSYSNDKNNSAEMHRTTSRLYQRLKRLGFRLQSGRTVSPDGRRKIELKRVPIPHGFKITNAVTGELIAGGRFELTVDDIEKFWEQEKNQQSKAKRKAAAQKRREKYKPRIRSRNLDADEDPTDNDEIDLSFDWESSERFFDD